MSEHDKLREAIILLRHSVENHRDVLYAEVVDRVCAAAESTLPKTRMVEVWHVEFAYKGRDKWEPALAHGPYDSERDAHEIAARLRENSNNACIRVTGPHQQEVPA